MKEFIHYVKKLREKHEIYLENPTTENFQNFRDVDEIVKYLCNFLEEDFTAREGSVLSEIFLN